MATQSQWRSAVNCRITLLWRVRHTFSEGLRLEFTAYKHVPTKMLFGRAFLVIENDRFDLVYRNMCFFGIMCGQTCRIFYYLFLFYFGPHCFRHYCEVLEQLQLLVLYTVHMALEEGILIIDAI